MQIDIREEVERVYREQSRQVLATLIRLLGDFNLAEEVMQEAFAIAFTQWASDGLPENPRAWLISTARFKAIDSIRRRARRDAHLAQLAELHEKREQALANVDCDTVEDDRLRLIFTCCHPAISLESQIALTLREVCGLRTEEVASALLVSPATLAQRIVRAKAKIRTAGIPYEIPSRDELPERLDAVLHVIYLVFNEGYAATSGQELTRGELSGEAIRLGRLLVNLLPEPEAIGLLALMLLHESRRHARSDEQGNIILLEDQDRSLWCQPMIQEGIQLVEQALATRTIGSYVLQAAIAAVHAEAKSPAETDWGQIANLYRVLMQIAPSPIIELNHAVAVGMHKGADAGLELIEKLLDQPVLENYHLAHAARADFCRRLKRWEDAQISYARALELATLEPERAFLTSRIEEMTVLSASHGKSAVSQS